MEVANLYDNGPMSPICQIKEHLSIQTDNSWKPYEVNFIEPIPRSSAFVVDLINVFSGGVGGVLAPGASIAGQLIPVIQCDDNELIHLRWYVLDDIEGQLWQLSSTARFAPRGAQAGVNLFTPTFDPWLATTTFWVLGTTGNRDARIGCTNLGGAILPQARVGFFGYRYLLSPEERVHPNARYLPSQGK